MKVPKGTKILNLEKNKLKNIIMNPEEKKLRTEAFLKQKKERELGKTFHELFELRQKFPTIEVATDEELEGMSGFTESLFLVLRKLVDSQVLADNPNLLSRCEALLEEKSITPENKKEFSRLPSNIYSYLVDERLIEPIVKLPA